MTAVFGPGDTLEIELPRHRVRVLQLVIAAREEDADLPAESRGVRTIGQLTAAYAARTSVQQAPVEKSIAKYLDRIQSDVNRAFAERAREPIRILCREKDNEVRIAVPVECT